MLNLVIALGLVSLSLSVSHRIPYPQRWLDAGPESGQLIVDVSLTSECGVIHEVVETPSIKLSAEEIDALVVSAAFEDVTNHSPESVNATLATVFGHEHMPDKNHVWTKEELAQVNDSLSALGPWPITRRMQGWKDQKILKCEFSMVGELEKSFLFNFETKEWDLIANSSFLEGMPVRRITFKVV